MAVVVAVLGLAPWSDATALGARSFGPMTALQWSTNADTRDHDANFSFSLVDESGRPAYVREIGSSGPGFDLVRPARWGRVEKVPGHGSLAVTVSFHVTHCAPLPVGSNVLMLDASWTRSHWRAVRLDMNAPGEWQRAHATLACGAGPS